MSLKILTDAFGTAADRRRVRRGAARIALLALAASLAGCASEEIYPPVPQNVASSVDPNSPALLQAEALQRAIAAENKDDVYRIGKNDVLDIKVFNHPELNVTERVGGDGKISFPPLGDVTAAGLSERELQQQIQKSLRDGFINEAQVTATVSEIKAASVGAIGAGVKTTRKESRPTARDLKPGPKAMVVAAAPQAARWALTSGDNVATVSSATTAPEQPRSIPVATCSAVG